MKSYPPSLFLITGLTCLGFSPGPAGGDWIHQPPAEARTMRRVSMSEALNSQKLGGSTKNSNSLRSTLEFELERVRFLATAEVAQAISAPETDRERILERGNEGEEVRELQNKLKNLGYYEGEVNGKFEDTTETAVSKFQEDEGLQADGKVGQTTRERLEEKALALPQQKTDSAVSKDSQKKSRTLQPQKTDSAFSKIGNFFAKKGFFKDWQMPLAIALGTFCIAVTIAATIYTRTHFGEQGEDLEPESRPDEPSAAPNQSEASSQYGSSPHPDPAHPNHQSNGYSPAVGRSAEQTTPQKQSDNLAIEETTRLKKIDIVEELIGELQTRDPTQRRKAIWELGQRGDSRAVQPLVNLMSDSDSKQRSLILGAISEIGTRTFKPMNQALAMSLQDNNPEVRKNAIRDLTRIYDLVSQISELLRHAVDDSDPEVQETAKWALNQLSRIRTPPGTENRSSLPNWTSSPENSREELP